MKVQKVKRFYRTLFVYNILTIVTSTNRGNRLNDGKQCATNVPILMWRPANSLNVRNVFTWIDRFNTYFITGDANSSYFGEVKLSAHVFEIFCLEHRWCYLVTISISPHTYC